ncbi:MAG TPA: hypothetical protein PLV91_01335 [Verrucomicrobiota bacterium]|nr:hypothetical protein [Verrucomicrobiota bacterium]
MNNLNSFRRNERVSSSLKWAAFLAAWALVSPWAFSAPAEGPQPDAGPQTQNMLGQTLKEHKEAMPVAPDTGDFWKDALKYKEAIPVAPDSGDFWEDALKSYMKELEKANRERERMLEEYNEQMNRMLEEMGREPFDNWPPANISPRMFRHPAAESDLEARLERLEKRLQSLERPETVQPGAAASPTLEEIRRAARRIQNRVKSQNMTAEEGLERLLKRILGGQNSGKAPSQSEE